MNINWDEHSFNLSEPKPNKHDNYEIGLFWAEKPQSKGFRLEPYLKEGIRQKNTYRVVEEKAWFQEGIYTTKAFNDITDFANFLENDITSNHYITSGKYSPKEPVDEPIRVVKGADVKGNDIARKEIFIKGSNSPGIMCIDIDSFKGIHLSIEETMDKLLSALPELKNAPMVIVPSTGSNISLSTTGNVVPIKTKIISKDGVIENGVIRGIHGFHIFVGVSSNWSMPVIIERINQRMWLNDCGFITVSKDGSLLTRCLIDTSVLKTIQPIYTRANVEPRLVQDLGKPWIINANQPPFSLSSIRKLDKEDHTRYKSLVEEAKEDKNTESETKRLSWARERAENSEIAKSAIGKGTVIHGLLVRQLTESFVKTSKDRVLGGNQEVLLQPLPHSLALIDKHGNPFISVTIDEILQKPEMYHGARCACIEDPYYAPGGGQSTEIAYDRARIYIKHEPYPRILDFAHGGVNYKLLRDKKRIDLVGDDFNGIVDIMLEELTKRSVLFKQGTIPYVLLPDNNGKLVLKRIDDISFRYNLAENFSFREYKRGKDGGIWEEMWPRLEVSCTSLRRFCLEEKNNVLGIFSIPFLSINGKLRIRKGYDSSTGFIYDEQWNGFRRLGVVTDYEMKAALATIEAPIAKFKFSDDISRANMLSAMLTIILRQWFIQDSNAMYPGFTADAPGNGIGKTKLLQILGVLSEGHIPYTTRLDHKEEERNKQIGSKLADGNSFFLFDNVNGKIDSDSLAQLMTSKKVSFRVLGLSKENLFDNNSFVTASGKNMKLSPELIRRFLNIRIEPANIDYLTHDYGFDPVEYTLSHRFEIVNALMTLFIGYKQYVNGLSVFERDKLESSYPNLGSFEVWSREIGGCVKYVGTSIAESGQYDFPGSDVGEKFIDEMKKDKSRFESFMKAIVPEYQDDLKRLSEISFKWGDIKDKFKDYDSRFTGSPSIEDTEGLLFSLLFIWLDSRNCFSGRVFSGLVKDFLGDLYENEFGSFRFFKTKGRNAIYKISYTSNSVKTGLL